jgi:hypothetical protein
LSSCETDQRNSCQYKKSIYLHNPFSESSSRSR